MSITLEFTEDKMKAGTKRLLAELRLAGVNVDNLNYNKALHVFSKAVLDKPYEEVKGAYLDKQTKPEKDHRSVMILSCGSNDILVLDGLFEVATNPGTDLEIPYHALEAQAKGIARKLGVSVFEVTLPDILQEPESDEEWVELAREMGYFEPQGSIFDQFEVDHIMVDGHSTEYRIDGDWRDALENSDDPENEVIWHVEAQEGVDKYEFFFTFGELKRAQYQFKGSWVVPNASIDGDEIPIMVSFLNINLVIATR